MVDENPKQNNETVITDIKIPFWSIVIIMIKWVLATIPAFIIYFMLLSTLNIIINSNFITTLLQNTG